MTRGQLPARLLPTCRHRGGDGPERMSGRTTICRNTPSNIMPPARSQPGSSAEVSLGVRGHSLTPQRAHAPPIPSRGFRRHPCRRATSSHTHPPSRRSPRNTTRLTGPSGTSKQSPMMTTAPPELAAGREGVRGSRLQRSRRPCGHVSRRSVARLCSKSVDSLGQRAFFRTARIRQSGPELPVLVVQPPASSLPGAVGGQPRSPTSTYSRSSGPVYS
jgi:hypothetical protein